MKHLKRTILSSLVVVVCILLIGVCFVASAFIVENYARADCFDNIEEVTSQTSNMFQHNLTQSMTQLGLFADILGANSYNPDELLQAYMENFCDTQNFSAVCVHRPDGTTFSYGQHPHDGVFTSFEAEVAKTPYVSPVCSAGETRSEQFVYLATPVVRSGEIIAVLYGYISLDTFPTFISSTAYDGKGQFYIVDGDTGNFLMDEYHRYGPEGGDEIPLLNAFDGSMGDREAKTGYTAEDMNSGIQNGRSGYYIFKSQRTGQWYYTYYMPMGINNWSMQMTIDEPTAFATYYDVRDMVTGLMVSVLLLCVIIIVVLILQTRNRAKKDKRDLHKADYLNKVQSALLTAHNNPDFVGRALKLVTQESKGEKAILLTLSDYVIRNIYYWPSLDMNQAKVLIGVNIREEFPSMFDALSSGENFICDSEIIEKHFTPKAKALFQALSVHHIVLVPIADATGILKAALAVLNTDGEVRPADTIECVTRDFFMAITNLESHNIIRRMGAIDYLTGIKNRNSYEIELGDYETVQAESLWCVYVDANGLHELNNSRGHKAGDAMLCAVADSMRKNFGENNCYRIGGDEFIAFRTNSSKEELDICTRRMVDELARRGYSISVGYECAARTADGHFDMSELLAQAEALMYSRKWKYYEQNGISKERSYLPMKQPVEGEG